MKNRWRAGLIHLHVVCLLFLSGIGTAWGAMHYSAGYRETANVFSAGGGTVSSSSYALRSALGQQVVGTASSSSYILHAGFFPITAVVRAATTIAPLPEVIRGTTCTIAGTAVDLGPGISAIEISTDGGTTWSVASGIASWTYDWILPPDGTYTVCARIVDGSGKPQPTSSINVVRVDNTPPTGEITYSSSGPYWNGETVTITATFSEPMATSPAPELVFSDADTRTVTPVRVDDRHFTYDYAVGSASGTVGISFSSGTDVAGNPVVTSPVSGGSFVIDNITPVTSVSYAPVGPYLAGENVVITARFVKPVPSTATPAITLSGADTLPSTPMTRVSDTEFSYAYTAGSGTGTVVVRIVGATDVSGNPVDPTPTSGATFAIDGTAPTAAVAYVSAPPFRHGEVVTVNVTFSEALSADSAPRISFSGLVTLDPTPLTMVDGTHGTYSFTVGSGDGTVDVRVTGAADQMGNPVVETPVSGASFTVDNTAPTASVSYAPQGPYKQGDVVLLSVTFSEPMSSSPAPKVALMGANVLVWTPMTCSDATHCTFLHTVGAGSGTVNIAFASGTDLAGNPVVSAPAAGGSFIIDAIPPTAEISYSPAPPYRAGDKVTITAAFSEEMAAVPEPTIAFSGAASLEPTAMFRTDATHYTYVFTVGDGTGDIVVALGTGTDLAGNVVISVPTSGATFAIDNTPPTASVAYAPAGPFRSGQDVTIRATFSEPLAAAPKVVLAGAAVLDATEMTAVDASHYVYRYRVGSGTGVVTVSFAGAADAAGNAATTTADGGTFTIDDTPPTCAIIAPTDGSVSGSSVNLAGTAADVGSGVGTVEVSTDNGATWTAADGTTSWTYAWTAPSDGLWPLGARSVDAAGNVAAASAITVAVSASAPDTIIASAPADPSPTATAEFTFVATKAYASFECAVDSATYAACSSLHTVTSLLDGRHTLSVRARDISGAYDATPASYSWSVNTSSPLAVLSGVPASPAASDGATITVSGNGIGTYRYRVDGGSWSAETAIAVPITLSSLADGVHTLAVEGNASGTPQAAATTVSWTVDTQAPATTIIVRPASVSGSSSGLFAFASSEPGSTFRCAVDGGAAAACSSPFTYSGLGDGTHTFSVVATDLAGNTEQQPVTAEWRIDTTSVTASLSGVPGAYTRETSAVVTVSGSGVAAYRYDLDGGGYSSESDVSAPISLTGLSDGFHVLTVEGRNSAGLYQEVPTSVSWIVDTAPPVVTFGDRPAAFTGSRSGSIAFTASETVTGFSCSLDSGAFTSCSSPFAFNDLADGQHSLAVVATDQAGNSGTPAVLAWTIDNSAPTGSVAIDGGAPFTNSTSVTLTLSASDASGVSEMCISSDTSCSAWQTFVAETPWILAPGDGVKTIRVWFRDALGTVSTEPATAAITVETIPPELLVSTLPSGSITDNATLNVAGTVTDSSGIASLSVNDAIVPVGSDGSFSYALQLTEGPNTVAVIATDVAGNTASDVRTIVLDRAVPVITIAYPPDNSRVNDPAVTLTGSVNNTSTIVVVLNGEQQPVSVTGNGFTTDLVLVQGVNTIEITATDVYGVSATVKRTVTYDAGLPALAVTDPGYDLKTSSSSLVVSGTVSDFYGEPAVTITVGTQVFQVPVTNGTFQQEVLFGQEKVYTIVVAATDSAGNTATVERNVFYAKLGDPNGTGDVTITDAVSAYLMYLGRSTPTALDVARCDVAPLGPDGKPQGNGVIDVGDVILIMRHIVGLVPW